MAFIITDGNNFVRIGDNNKFEIVADIFEATRFKFEKAKNYLNNNMRPRDNYKNWSVISDVNGDIDFIDLDEIRMMQEELYAKLQMYNNELNTNLSITDKEINDIQHYMEFFNLDAAKGYKAYKMMHDRLIKRRKIKDDMYKSLMLLNAKADDYINGTVEKEFGGYDNKMYSPRVLKELFE